MSGKPLWDGFYDAWVDFKSRDKNIEIITNYIQSSEGREALRVDKVTNILSIGAGTGELEHEIMKLCPNLKEMTLLDADCNQHKALEERFHTQSQVKVECHNIRFEDYEGAKSGFDTVFCSHVFYYFTDMEKQWDRALSLVKKGGQLVVIITQPNSVEPILVKHTEFNNCPWTYEKIKFLLTKQGLDYTEKELPNEFDFSGLGENGSFDLIDLISNKPVSLQEKIRVMEELESSKAFVPGTKTIRVVTAVFIVKRK